MRTASYSSLLSIIASLALLSGCEKQDMPVRSADQSPSDATEGASRSGPALPGSTGYYNALSGAKETAENTVQKADDYNRKLEEQMDDLFTD